MGTTATRATDPSANATLNLPEITSGRSEPTLINPITFTVKSTVMTFGIQKMMTHNASEMEMETLNQPVAKQTMEKVHSHFTTKIQKLVVQTAGLSKMATNAKFNLVTVNHS